MDLDSDFFFSLPPRFESQNYSCSVAGTWASVGAVAQLFDVSCLASSPDFHALPAQSLAVQFDPHPAAPCRIRNFRRDAQTAGANAGRSAPGIALTLSLFCASSPLQTPSYLGFHSFVTPSGGSLSPKFDFSQSQKNPTSYVIAKKVGAVPSPANATTNVAWLELASNDAAGTLAKTVFRTDTSGGQPPAGNVRGTLFFLLSRD